MVQTSVLANSNKVGGPLHMSDANGQSIVRVTMLPVITDAGTVARIVQLSDGSGKVQTYSTLHGWTPGGATVYSVMVAPEGADEQSLSAKGYSKEQIAEILDTPETGTDPT